MSLPPLTEEGRSGFDFAVVSPSAVCGETGMARYSSSHPDQHQDGGLDVSGQSRPGVEDAGEVRVRLSGRRGVFRLLSFGLRKPAYKPIGRVA
jgi:hypothetical protein